MENLIDVRVTVVTPGDVVSFICNDKTYTIQEVSDYHSDSLQSNPFTACTYQDYFTLSRLNVGTHDVELSQSMVESMQ